jgi:LEA14-like dessication related protein
MAGVLLFAGCESLKQLIKKPTVEYRGMSVKAMTLFDGTFVFSFNVMNPNPIGVPLDQVTYAVKIDGRDFIKGNLDQKIALPGNGTAGVNIPVGINYMDFFKSLMEFSKKDQLAYDVSGTVLVYGFTLPFHVTGTVPVPKPPKVSIARVDVKSMSFASASVVFVLDMVNDNPFPIMMNGLDYKIRIGGNDLAGGATRAAQAVGQNGRSTLEVPVNLSVLKVGKAVLDILAGSSSDYEMEGSMAFQVPKIGEKKFAFSKKGTAAVGRH